MKRFFIPFTFLALAACGSSTINGAGGNTGTGGDTGTGGETGSTTATVTQIGTTSSSATCMECLTRPVTWGPTGGNKAFSTSSALSTCRTYEHDQTPLNGTSSPKSCTAELPACTTGGNLVATLEAALDNPEVLAAFSQDNPIFGTDPRPCDGSVLSITFVGKTILVGGECGVGQSCSTATCVPIPAGVSALAAQLRAIDTQMLATPACQAVFP